MLWARQALPEREKEQRLLKAELLLDGAALLGLDALGPGDGDLAFGLDFLLEAAERRSLPYVSANLARRDGALVFAQRRVVERAGLKLGITSVLSDQLHVPRGSVLPVVPALRDAVAALRNEDRVDLVIVLSHLGLSVDRTIAADIEGIDLIFGGHSRSHQEDPLIVGKTAIFQAGSRGKSLGQVGVTLREGARGWLDPAAGRRVAAQRQQLQSQLVDYRAQLARLDPENEHKRARLEQVVEFSERRLAALPDPAQTEPSESRNLLTGEKVPLNRKITDHPEMQALVDAALERLGPQAAGHDHAGHAHGGHDHAGKGGSPPRTARKYGDYVGQDACKSCHAAQYKDWQTTGHAHAYSTLVKERRHFDLDCWSCHVTGAKAPGGPVGPYDVGPLRNVQCEACHGPGRAHVSNPAADMKRVPDEAHCKSCHSDEQTEGRFDYQSYLQRVDHLP